ncbi:hypothetical protein BB560_004868 [Smittium megazygosporum]|uniref:Aspartic peptidase DDI1-type domain-containing protein n=1 Tax=Smittium megazygosporum TaxID=133381 RepID=A0A2T9Z814_9FUNG|nr:hypothetical protein BB560_004868 [Smittium megazygosporum]
MGIKGVYFRVHMALLIYFQRIKLGHPIETRKIATPSLPSRIGDSLTITKAKHKHKHIIKSALPERILNSPAPITNRELLLLKSGLIPETISSLHKLDKEKPRKFVLYSENSTNKNPLSYIMTKINGQNVPMFLDIGAMHSLIHQKLARHLQLPFQEHPKPIYLSPISGPKIEVTHYVTATVEFEGDILIPMKFHILEHSTVKLLLGLDICQQIGAKIDYNAEGFSFATETTDYTTQIFSREQIIEKNIYSDDEEEPYLGINLLLFATEKKELSKSEPDGMGDGIILNLSEEEFSMKHSVRTLSNGFNNYC